jgi:hypothetical protein
MGCAILIVLALIVFVCVLIDNTGIGISCLIGLAVIIFFIFFTLIIQSENHKRKKVRAKNRYKNKKHTTHKASEPIPENSVSIKEQTCTVSIETTKTQYQSNKQENQANMQQSDKKYINGVPFWLQQSNPPDSDVIDITSIPACIIPDPKEDELNMSGEEYFTEAPYWHFHYVYSYDEIHEASRKQKQFYFFFKKKFMDGECFDLKENTNYAFILLFDLLNEYDKHGDIDELEKQLKLLGQHYHKTKSYANSFLLKKIRDSGNSEKAQILTDLVQ